MPTSPVRSSRRVAARRKVVEDEDETEIPTQREDVKSSPRKATTRNTTRRTRTTAAADKIESPEIFSQPAHAIESPEKKAPPKRRTMKEARAARLARNARREEVQQPQSTSAEETTITEDGKAEEGETGVEKTQVLDQTEATVMTEVRIDTTVGATDVQTGVQDVEMEDAPPIEETAAVEAGIPTPRARSPIVKTEIKKIDPTTTKMERPMDIVVRTKALGIPQSQEPAENRPRLVITHLVLSNFKSYAGRQVIGPFHATFSSVVGPNGSGKSNVIDSLLFVFGFRASKMRQGKISALIHNSAQYPDLDHCEVEVHFQEVMDQPNGESIPVPNSQLVVSRRAFKNNSSKYYINDKTSDFTTVTTLLKGRGIDLDHKRFLILQGEVESIAQMKPKAANEHDDGLLEYLEDIIGTSKYKTPIEEAAAETETLNDVCQEKLNRVQHVEKEKASLESKKDAALKYIHDENELVLKQSALYQLYIAECADNMQVTTEAIEQIKLELVAEEEKHGGSEAEMERLEKLYDAGSKEYQSLEKETASVLKEMARLDKETVKFEEKKKFLLNKAKKLEKTFEASKFGIHESETLIKNASDDLVRLTAEIEGLEKEMAVEDRQLGVIVEGLKGKTQGFSDKIAAKQRQLEPWNAKISEKQSAIAVAQSELDMLRERENAGATAVAEVQAKIEGLVEQRKATSAELEESKKKLVAVAKNAASVKKQIQMLAAQEPALKSKLSNSRQKADEAHASLAAAQSQGAVLSGLTRLKESGRIEGFHGRLGNLGTIDQKFDVAISTACPSLDNLVVDNVEIGQQCIEYLRKNNLGRANFILLDKLPQRDLSAVQTPENVPRLFDLIKSRHDRFLPAFYSILQNTLVAKNLEQANRIAYGAKKWRVVTLDGQLIDKSGTMSGGGTKVAKGGMSAKLASDVTREQVVKMDEDRHVLEKQLDELQESKRELETQLHELQEQQPKLETRTQKADLELDSIERNIADAKKRMQELGAVSQPSKTDKTEMEKLEGKIEKLQSEVSQLQSETGGVEEEIKQLQDKIMEVGGVKLRSQKSKVDSLKEQIATLTESLSTTEVTKTKALKSKSKHEKALAEATVELEKSSSERDQIESDLSSQNANTRYFRDQADEAALTLEEKKSSLSALKSTLDTLRASLNEARSTTLSIRTRLSESERILLENTKRSAHWRDQHSKLTLQTYAPTGEASLPSPVPELSKDELTSLNKSSLKLEITTLEEHLSSSPTDLSVLAEYQRRVSEHTSRLTDLNTALLARDTAKRRLDDLRRLRLEGFMAGFSHISLKLKEMYQMITMGGNAELELVDSLDPFAEGILFSVMPPKKSWKNIGNLSGGEKTLSSLALVFALHLFKPTPVYVMDEIDAALDYRNVSIVAAYIKERTKNAQFIVISLRNNMFELAARLVGVSKVNHMTRSVAVENRDFNRRDEVREGAGV